MDLKMKLAEKENEETMNGHRHHLRRYKYLKVEPAMVKNVHLRFTFMALAAFCIGIVVGFNIKDIMIRSCGMMPSMVQMVEKRAEKKPIIAVRPQILKPRDPEHPKPKREEFEKLPDKFLTNVKMPPPANYFPIRPWKVLEEIGNYPYSTNNTYFMTFLVKSAVGFARRRFQIRQTWGSMSVIEERRIAVLFVTGIASSQTQQKLLEKENQLYGDIIQGDVSDTYRNLPSKVLSGYQFVVERLGNSSEYYVSTDDDCFINMPNTYSYFTNLDPAKRNAAHCGYMYAAKADRISNMKSKWGVAEEIYPMKPYPKFCHGGMTILSFDILRDIYRVSLITNYTAFHLEDVLTNGILREKLRRGDDSISSAYLRDPKTKRRLPLMWHLGYRKDKDVAFIGIWSSVRRRLASYAGTFDPEKGYRAVIDPIITMEGKSLDDTINYFSPFTPHKVSSVKKATIKVIKGGR